jgi:DNA-directed RNA polymerase subunit RPC12/RpoP
MSTVDIKCSFCLSVFEADENITEDFLECPSCGHSIILAESIVIEKAEIKNKKKNNLVQVYFTAGVMFLAWGGYRLATLDGWASNKDSKKMVYLAFILLGITFFIAGCVSMSKNKSDG